MGAEKISHENNDVSEVVSILRSRLPGVEISHLTFDSGDFMVDLVEGEDIVVLERHVATSEYGVSKNPELFAGADAVFTELQLAIDAAVDLIPNPQSS